MTDLIALSDLQSRLQLLSETKVNASDAYAILRQTQIAYEAERATAAQLATQQAANIAFLNANAIGLSDEVVGLLAQIATLKNQLAVATADVHVTVGTTPITSRTTPAVSFIENPPIWTSAAWSTAKASLAQCCGAYKVHLFPFGLLDPQTDPTKPIDFLTGQRLGNALSKIREVDAFAPIVLTLYAAPWWMKGKLSQTGGVTTLMTASEEYGANADQGRVMLDKLPQWLALVDKAVVLAASFGVHDFEVWNEAKGYYSVPSGTGQTWDGRYSAGTSGHADMGYSYFYEATAKQVVATMTRMAVARTDYRIAGPYAVLSSKGALTTDAVDSTHPLYQFGQLWGYANKAPINFVREFLGNARDHGFALDSLSLDISTYLQDGNYPTANPFDLSRKVGDVVPYWRATLAEFGFDPDLPVDFSELYNFPQPALQDANSEALRSILWADCLKSCVLNRVRYPIMWGPTSPAPSQGSFSNLGGLIDSSGNLQATGRVFKAFRDHFGSGTQVYAVTCSDSRVDGLGNADSVTVWNRTAAPLSVAIDGQVISLAGYDMQQIKRGTA